MRTEAKAFRGAYLQVHGGYPNLDDPDVLLACGSCPWTESIAAQVNYGASPDNELSEVLENFLLHDCLGARR